MRVYTFGISTQKTKLVMLFLFIVIFILCVLRIIESLQFHAHEIYPAKVKQTGVVSNEIRFDKYFYGPVTVPYIPGEDFEIPLNNKYIIYRCDGNGLCGGFADRMEGIVAGYLLSQMLRRKFGIRMTVPCDLTMHLVPNIVDWLVDDGQLRNLSVRNLNVIDHAAWKLREQMTTMDLNASYPEDVLYFKVNQEFVKYLMKNKLFKTVKWAENLSVPEIYNVVYRRLFQLDVQLDLRFYKFQMNARRESRKLVCSQIRVWRNPTIPNDFEPEQKLNVSIIWDFLKRYNDSSKYSIFISTDSEDVRKTGVRLFPEVITDIGGNIVHIEQTQGKSVCSGFSKVVLDQLVLSTCDVLVLTYSGIGRIASFLRGNSQELYCTPNRKIEPCSIFDPDYIPYAW